MSESITYEPIQLDLFFDLDNAKAESSVINQKISSLSDSKTKRNSIATVGIVGAIVGG